MIQRYSLHHKEDEYTGDDYISMAKNCIGEWVKYEDIKHLLQNTSSNSEYMQCQHEYVHVSTSAFIGYKCKKCGHCT